jgi:hypothetical protein
MRNIDEVLKRYRVAAKDLHAALGKQRTAQVLALLVALMVAQRAITRFVDDTIDAVRPHQRRKANSKRRRGHLSVVRKGKG